MYTTDSRPFSASTNKAAFAQAFTGDRRSARRERHALSLRSLRRGRKSA